MYMGQVGGTVRYERKIRYLDFVENGQRSQGAGFIKLERRDELCNISLQISGIYRRDRLTRPLLLVGKREEREMCKLQLADGGIKTCFEGLDSRDLGGQGIGYDDLYGIRIPISDGKEIRCIWRHRETESTEEGEAGAQNAAMQDIEARDAEAWNAASQEAEPQGAVTQEAGAQNAEIQDTEARDVGAQNVTSQEAEPQGAASQDTEARNRKEQGSGKTIYKEDKWEQLWMIYPHVRPFSDEREYLSIGPSDFVLLGSRSYKLVGNSFLLHGYYNFRHLILMRGGRRNQRRYYVGVPGNLYERDKKTALMFGFEGFECAKEPAEEGDFGYFLIPVEL